MTGNFTLIKALSNDAYQKALQASQHNLQAKDKLAEAKGLMRESMLALRKDLGMTAKQFGKTCGASKAYVYLLEKGERPWNQKLINRLLSHIEKECPPSE